LRIELYAQGVGRVTSWPRKRGIRDSVQFEIIQSNSKKFKLAPKILKFKDQHTLTQYSTLTLITRISQAVVKTYLSTETRSENPQAKSAHTLLP
jgi:hypothetical protein